MKMQMETDSKIRLTRILFLIGQVIFLKVSIYISKNITCPFKKIFHIPCPFCGMTRSYHELLKLNIIKSIHYNILLIPLIIILITIDIIILLEIIKNKKIISNMKIDKKILLLILILLIISISWGTLNNI